MILYFFAFRLLALVITLRSFRQFAPAPPPESAYAAISLPQLFPISIPTRPDWLLYNVLLFLIRILTLAHIHHAVLLIQLLCN